MSNHHQNGTVTDIAARTEPHRTRNRAILIALWVPSVFTLVLACLAIQGQHARDLASQWIIHTVEVKEKIGHLDSLVKDVETSQRGYLLTGNTNFLELYETAVKSIPAQSQSLALLIADNPRQVAATAQLQKLIAEKLAQASQSLSLARQSDFPAAIQIVRSGKGRQIMDEIRPQVAAMTAEENRLLIGRENTFSLEAKSQNSLMIGLVSVDFALILGATLLILRLRKSRQSAEARTDRAITQAEFANIKTDEANVRTDEANARSARAIRDSEISYRRLFEAAEDGILILDGDSGRIHNVNPFLDKLLGYRREEMVGKFVWDFIPTQDFEANKVKFAELQRDGAVRYENLPMLAKEGQCINVEFVSTVYEAGGKKVIQCNVRDITERKKVEATLARLAAIVESSDDAIIGKDMDGIIHSWNHGAEKLFGHTSGEMVGTSILRLVPAALRAEQKEILEKIKRGEGVDQFETRRQAKDGREIDVSVTASPIKDAHGKVIGVSKVVRDISERKQAEAALLRLAAIVESSDDAIIGKDLNSIITSWNRGAEKIFGYTAGEMVGTSILRLIPADRQDEENMILNKIKHSESVEHFETLRQVKDGRQINVSLTASPIKDASGKVIGVSKVARDITERKHAEHALEASELTYRRLFEAAKDGILILEVDTGRITDVNPFLTELLGFPRDEMVGKTVGELSPFKDIESNKIMLERLQKDGYVRYDDLPLETRDGRKIAVEFVSNVYEAGGHNVIQCNVRDITVRKQIEKQLKTSLKETGDLNTEIQNFYHTLSHELKTPLTSAREFVSIVMDGLAGPLNPTQLEYLGIAKESCDQLRRYINDLLDVTRLETGKMSIEFQKESLPELLEHVVEMLAPAAAGKNISLTCEGSPNLPDVPIDKQRILQVLTNLTTNAIKFTSAGGNIHLSVGEFPAHPECLRVDVRDTGQGISKDQIPMLFNRLFQTDHNVESGESRNGLGLGLYICKELVELHSGSIWVESEVGKGSTFSFGLPKQAMMNGVHVFIVDDDLGLREMLRLALEKQNFTVTTAESGIEALQLIGKKIPHVVVLDLKMAGLDGPETLKEIRKHWGLLPVIVYTGYPDGDLMRQAMESSPFTLLAKPCPTKQFVETIRRMCHPTDTRFIKKNGNGSHATDAQKIITNGSPAEPQLAL